jgi:hypothetical protein
MLDDTLSGISGVVVSIHVHLVITWFDVLQLHKLHFLCTVIEEIQGTLNLGAYEIELPGLVYNNPHHFLSELLKKKRLHHPLNKLLTSFPCICRKSFWACEGKLSPL